VASLAVLFIAWQGRIGADLYWAVAMGKELLETWQVPQGVPFAAAPSAGWPNVSMLAQVLFAAVANGGSAALLFTQVFVVGVVMFLLALDGSGVGAADTGIAASLLLLTLGALPTLAIIRLQSPSLLMFPLLLLLLRAQARSPSRKIWLVVPLVAIWGNLHGAVLVGLCVTLAYLGFGRFRQSPATAIGAAVACVAGLHINPAGWNTWHYYRGVLQNEAARRNTELWARPSLSEGFDVLMLIAASILIIYSIRARRPIWEYVCVGGLALGTLLAARNGVWLLMFCATPAALGLSRFARVRRHDPRRLPSAQVLITTAAVTCAVLLIFQRGDRVAPISEEEAQAVVKLAAGQVLLAPEPAVESFAAAGATVWMANPIDAFQREDQAAYLDFLSGGPLAIRAVEASDIVVVPRGSQAAKRFGSATQLETVPGAPEWQYFRPIRPGSSVPAESN
jgi:hypothetical protein